MANSRDPLTATSLELAWRQWKALGVSAAGAIEPGMIDPEALILFTAALGDADPRLRDESTDWCVGHGARSVAGSRLRNLRARATAYLVPEVDEYIATVNATSQARWPVTPGVTPRSFTPSGKSTFPRLFKSRPLVRLQLRALFGPTARAEVLAVFLTGPHVAYSASDLTFTGYSKRNIALVLEDLAAAEVLAAKARGNQNTYRCIKHGELRALAPAAQPGSLLRWDLWFEALTALRQLILEVAGKPPVVQGVRARRLAEDLQPVWAGLDLRIPAPSSPETHLAQVEAWLLDATEEHGLLAG